MKVLLATDGSEFSEKAVQKFCALFDESVNTQIRIISAVESRPYVVAPYGLSVAFYEEVKSSAQALADQAVQRASEEIRTRFPDLAAELSTATIDGSPAAVIVEEAERWGADLIIVGSHGYGFWQRALIGSVSDSVTRHAPCSVLVVRPPKKHNGNAGRHT
jgi:nucleotide-binding universal stress UspA family protein